MRYRKLSVAICALLGGSAGAANLDYQVTLGAGYSDNIARTAQNETSDGILAPGLQFSFDEASRRLQADLVGNFAYYEYLDNTFDSELLGNFAGNARFSLVPQRFEWVVSDTFGQVLNDPFLPATPANRENMNNFMTGPDAIVPFGSNTRLRAGARYGVTTYEHQAFDSNTVMGQLALEHQLSAFSAVSLNGSMRQINYDESALNGDYDQTETFARYSAEGARTNLSVDAGYTALNQDATDKTQGGLLFRLEVARRLSESSTVSLSGGREFANSAGAFGAGQVGLPTNIGAAPGRQTIQPFMNEHVNLGYTFKRQRTGFSLSASWEDRSFEDQAGLDETLTGLVATVTRELTPRTTLAIDGGYRKGDFKDEGTYTDLSGGVSVNWRLSQRVTLAFAYDHFDRNSDRPAGDYTENRYWLTIGYGRGVPRHAPLPPRFGMDAAQPET